MSATDANELVSIALPARNRESSIGEAIRSALGQTYPHFELIVVDDGSTDSTADVARSFSDERITVVRTESGGVSRARNVALGLMKGRYVAFLDSDDIYLPKKLESQVALLRSRPDIMCAYSPYIEIHKGVEKYHPCGMGEGDLFIKMFKGSFVNVNTILIRKECADAVGGFPDGFTTLEDYDYFLRLAERYTFGRVAETSSVYRMSERDEADDTSNYLHYLKYIDGCPERFEKLRRNMKAYNWKRGKVLYGLGKSHFRAGRMHEAEKTIREALKYRWQPDVAFFLIKHKRKLRSG
ncbi:MAG TPA: glycosyltransferase family A protein [bacterium]|nr:MAG: UDP-Glc:alpha-D-GlcNAc-diphosphoundecaprenol beta-1,3-glucosyltransferase WfgD [bacterium ADurb.Bin236]HOY63299.1 glycosyltransferase family A protein [bacterium]HPI76255.1 glycosyltransferase family A protein [bacterium]HPN94780.1 glycosyltransferase family A protein [bacterium]